MLLPMSLNVINPIMKEDFIRELLELNTETRTSGLVLSYDDIRNILAARERILINHGRVELGITVTRLMIESFHNSAFINSDNYVSILNELHEIFYYIKNETEDLLSDDKLLEMMADYFENSCGGSIELLKSSFEEFAVTFRRNLVPGNLKEEVK